VKGPATAKSACELICTHAVSDKKVIYEANQYSNSLSKSSLFSIETSVA
jgi:hypothetical protein